MVYSCAYFENGDEDLYMAQLKKIDHILTKIQLQPGQILFIGYWVWLGSSCIACGAKIRC